MSLKQLRASLKANLDKEVERRAEHDPFLQKMLKLRELALPSNTFRIERDDDQVLLYVNEQPVLGMSHSFFESVEQWSEVFGEERIFPKKSD